MYQTLVICLFLLLPPLLLALLINKRSNSNKPNLPPSPPKLPIIGNLHQLGPVPYCSLRALSDKHGPLMHLQLGHVPTLIVSSPEIAREVMKTHDLIFATRPRSKIARLVMYGTRDIAFAPYSEYWRQARKLCVTRLLSAKMVQSFQLMREEEVESMITKISQISSSLGSVNVSAVLNQFSCDIICRAVSGKYFTKRGKNSTLLLRIVEENSVLAGAFHVGDFFPVMGLLDIFPLDARAKRNAKRWDDVLEEVLENHANQSQADAIAHNHTNFVDVLLSLEKDSSVDFPYTRESMKAILMDMFAAGTDTTYILLEWSMAELIRNPEVMRKLQGEVRGAACGKGRVTEDELSKLSYLKAVIKEVLRLHPPVPLLLPRESTENCKLAGYDVTKKTRVIINEWAISRDPNVWEEPEEFKPERFINSPIDFRGNDFQFAPFGAGRRICPGMNFAVQTAEVALANLVYRFDSELPGDMRREDLDMNDAPGVTVRRRERLELSAELFPFQ